METPLAKQGMLVKLIRRSWYGVKKDDSATSAAVGAMQASAKDAGAFHKHLLPKDALKPIRRIESDVYQFHKRLTAPWCYDGLDYLPSELFLDYTAGIRQYRDEHEKALNELLKEYPSFRAKRAQELGAMYNPNDYPPPDELKKKFAIEVHFLPVPDTEHLFLRLEEVELESIKNSIYEDIQQAQSDIEVSLTNRLRDALGNMHERLSDPANIFRQSLIENMMLLTESIPAFGFSKLSKIAQEAKELCAYSPEKLRTDMTARAKTAKLAEALLRRL